MNIFIVLLALASSFSSFASEGCVDLRKTFFNPCAPKQERIYERGNCKEVYEVEKTYCADKKEKLVAITGKAQLGMNMENFQEVLIQGTAVLSDENIEIAQADQFASSGFMASATKKLGVEVKNCSEGVYVITAGKGNILPTDDGTEIYLTPQIVSFTCIND